MINTISRKNKFAGVVGKSITISAIIFIALALIQEWEKVSVWHPNIFQLMILAVLPILYALALILLVFNWVSIISVCVAEPLPRSVIILSYTKTQLAKYVPGNVLQFVGRHIYLHDYGVAHNKLVRASMLEIAILPASTVFIFAIFFPYFDIGAFNLTSVKKSIWTFAIAISATIISIHFYLPKKWRAAFCVMLIRASLFMLFQGSIFAIILLIVTGKFVISAVPIAIFAWLIGFLTPGAPSGFAVRESMIVILLSYNSFEEHVLLSAILMRLISTIGDLVLFLSGNVLVSLRVKNQF